jgi:hypothetical protein
MQQESQSNSKEKMNIEKFAIYNKPKLPKPYNMPFPLKGNQIVN